MLGAVGGAVGTEVAISDWFFSVTSLGALLMIAGKRPAEHREMGEGARDFRAVLEAYSPAYTAYLRAVTSGGVLVAYCLWPFEKADAPEAAAKPAADTPQETPEQMVANLEKKAEELQNQAARRQQEVMEPIMQRVEEIISQVRQAEGYAIVFDVASEAIVSADPSLDLTTKVIERLKTAAPTATRQPSALTSAEASGTKSVLASPPASVMVANARARSARNHCAITVNAGS